MAVPETEYEKTDKLSSENDQSYQEELELKDYILENLETGMVSHTLEKVDARLEAQDNNEKYDLTVTQHPDSGSWIRASPEDGSEVYRKRIDFFPQTEAGIEAILDGETLDRAY
jgi:hypothetical protein